MLSRSACIVFCMFCLSSPRLLLGIEVSGRVFLDRNANGRFDAGEKGVAGVAFSDGRTVVVSGESGAYTLSSDAEEVLLRVATPSHHVVDGSFWRWTDGREPEDFALSQQAQAETFAFLHLTDTHIGRLDRLTEFAKRVNDFPFPLAFVVNTGDLVSAVDPIPIERAAQQFDRYLQGARMIELPLYELPGNHDHAAMFVEDADKTDPLYGKGMYRRRVGPTHYSWNYGGYHFVALDGTRLPYSEGLGKTQLAWLMSDLAVIPANTPVVLFCHQSLTGLRDKDELAQLLDGYRVVAAFCGHLHEVSQRRLRDIPVYQTASFSGAWWSGPNPDGSPQGFAIVRLSPGSVDYAYTHRQGRHSLYISQPDRKEVQSGVIPFEAIVLDGGDQVAVEARFGKQMVPMKQVDRRQLWSVWEGTVDSTGVYDGIRPLTVQAQAAKTTSSCNLDLLIVNGNLEEYTPRRDAVLNMKVRGIQSYDRVDWNGAPLGKIQRGIEDGSVITFKIPKSRLHRLNTLTVRAVANPGTENKDDFSIGSVWLEYAGKRIYDIRFPSFARHRIGDNEPKAYSDNKTLYLSLP